MFAALLSENPLMGVVTFIVLVLTLIIAKVFYSGDPRFFKLKQVIPGPKQLPLFGNTFQLLGSSDEILKTMSSWQKQYGSRILYRVGSYWIVSLAGANDLEKLLSSTTETVKSIDYQQFIPWLGEGLLISSGKKWSHRRKMLTPAFHFKILEQFVDIFNEQSFLLVKILKNEFRNGEQTFDIAPYITRCTLEIICETAMGVKINGQMEQDSEYLKALGRVKELQLYRGLRPWLENSLVWDLFSYGREEKKAIKILHSFTQRVIKDRKKEFLKSRNGNTNDDDKGKPKRRLALLDLMFEAQLNGEAFDDEGIREETDTFMFGGHDTTAAAASFSLFHIGRHPEVQRKIGEELDAVFRGDSERPVTSEDLPKLKYLECCIKESMRLTAPVPMTARAIQQEFQLDKGVTLPPETLVIFFPFELHRNPEVFPSPLEYRPERFLPENLGDRHPFAFLPFSAGTRNCIGQKFAMMEEKILLANFFRHLKIQSCDKLEDLILTGSVILHSENGINVRVSPK